MGFEFISSAFTMYILNYATNNNNNMTGNCLPMYSIFTPVQIHNTHPGHRPMLSQNLCCHCSALET